MSLTTSPPCVVDMKTLRWFPILLAALLRAPKCQHTGSLQRAWHAEELAAKWSQNFGMARCETRIRVQDEEKTPIKQDTKKGKLRFYPYNIKCAPLGFL